MRDVTATIFDIQKYSIHDGSGIRTLVFLKGCPLECLWCSNPESQKKDIEVVYFNEKCIQCNSCILSCPVGAITLGKGGVLSIDYEKCLSCGNCKESCYAEALKNVGVEYDVDRLMIEIKKDIPFYKNSNGGVTFSGGEPLLYCEFIDLVSKRCERLFVEIAIETCGYVSEKSLFCIIDNDNINTVMYDIKIINREKHKQYCGKNNDLILKNFQILNRLGMHDIIVRIPIIPGITDSNDNIKEICGFVKKYGQKVKRIDILPYHNFAVNKYKRMKKKYELNGMLKPSDSDMKGIKKLIESYDLDVQIGG